MRRLLALLHTIRGGKAADEATLNASAHVLSMRRLAEAHGFRRLGVVVEGFLTRPSLNCVVECWTDDLGVELHITDLFYFFETQFEDGACELTWSLKTPYTGSTKRMTSRPTSGSFAADLQAHREAVLSYGRSSPWSHRTLRAQVEMIERYEREHVPLLLGIDATFGPALQLLWLIPFALVALLRPEGWLFGLVGVAMMVAPLFNPVQRKRAALRERARKKGYGDVPTLIRAELGEALDAELERLDAKSA